MAITGNKGEWSEIYVLLKLLGDGEVHAGDENLNEIKNLVYPIIMILRDEAEGKLKYLPENSDVIIQTSDGTELLRLPAKEFEHQAITLLYAMQGAGGGIGPKGAFSLPYTEDFMTKIHCHTLKAKSSDKTDIRIILHDRRTRLNTEMGFSIKSQLGGDSTLLNASKATNFNFKICGGTLTDSDIVNINALNPKQKKVICRVQSIENKGCHLVFDKVDNPIFKNNLELLDSRLGEIIGLLLLEQLDQDTNMLKDLVKILSGKNPFHFDMSQSIPYYEYKVKNLLTSSALGMMPGKAWNGKYDANGGYLVVKESGDILCYHFYDRNRFEDFLYNNAYLERASTTRHDYAKIIKEADGSLSFKLNLQIRLK
jgi:hypothetical protein